MRSPLRAAAAAAVLATAVSLAGCGTSAADAMPAAGFRQQTTALCRADGGAIRKHLRPFPFASFNPLAPQPSQLPAVAAFYTSYDWQAALSVQSALHHLRAPQAGSARWQGFLRELDRYIATYRAQILAARRSDAKAFAATAVAFARLEPAVNAAAARAGVAACSPFHLGQ